MWRWFNHQIYFDKDEGGNGGGGNPPEPLKGFEALLQRAGDATALASRLYTENYEGREERRKLKAELDELRSKLPPDGHVVITADDAKLYEAYKALGKKPDELSELQGKLDGLRRDAVLSEAAKAHGYKSGVLKTLAQNVAIEMRTVEKDGQKSERAFVLQADGKAVDLDEHAKANWQDFLPSLVEQPAQTQPGNGANPKPAGAAGSGAADEAAKQSYRNTVRNWF